jgi:hypothetical protein
VASGPSRAVGRRLLVIEGEGLAKNEAVAPGPGHAESPQSVAGPVQGRPITASVTARRRTWLFLFRTSLYLIVAAVVLNTFMNQWGFRGHSPRYGFEALVSYEAHRPFAFRMLTPALINASTALVPRSLLDELVEWDLTRTKADGPWLSAHRRFGWGSHPLPQHYVAYLALWPVLFLLILAMRRLTRLERCFPDAFVDCAPALALLVLPLAFSRGGYVYDFPELLLITAALCLLVERRWVLYYACFMLACLNKETAILLVIYFVALELAKMRSRLLLAHIGMHALLGLPILAWQRLAFAKNPGAGAEFQLWENLRFLLSPEPWIRTWDPYGPLLPFPGPFNILSLVLIGGAVFMFWPEKPRRWRLAFRVMIPVLVSLVVLFGTRDEARNFSLIFPVTYLLACHTAARLYGLAVSATEGLEVTS